MQLIHVVFSKSCAPKRIFRLRQPQHFTTLSRQGFGSFHSEDIESLINSNQLNLDVYKQVVLGSSIGHVGGNIVFGKCNDHFAIKNDKWTFLNHGAFGGVLQPLMKESVAWKFQIEEQPLKFYDRDLFTLLAHTLQHMAQLINCPSNELLPLQNVTSGLNSIISSISLSEGDEVVCLSLTYGSTKKMLNELCLRTSATLRIVHIPLPVESEDQVMSLLSKEINCNTKLAVFDGITSNTAMALPVLRMASLCKEITHNQAVVVVDAAHSLMAQHVSIYPENKTIASKDLCVNSDAEDSTPLSISDVVDVWLSNGHKWLSAPKGCAFMWLSPTMRARGIRPAIISHGFQPRALGMVGNVSRAVHSDEKRVLSGFAWDGCRDYTAMLCVPSAIWIWESMPGGLSGCRQYMRTLLADATDLLTREWGLSLADFAAPLSMRALSPMSLVPLPERVGGFSTRHNVTDNHAFYVQERLHHEYAIEVPVKCLEGRLYVRISAHIYNHIEQYQRLASAIKHME